MEPSPRVFRSFRPISRARLSLDVGSSDNIKVRPIYLPPQPVYLEPSYYGDLFELSRQALNHYNANHETDEFDIDHLDPLIFREYTTRNFRLDGYLQHLCFIALNKKRLYYKLFYAEFAHRRQVQRCITVDPGNPLVHVSFGALYHPYDAKFAFRHGRASPLRIEYALAKKFFSDAYTISSEVEELDSDEVCEQEKKYIGHALLALNKFNSYRDELYEFVEIISCHRFVSDLGRYWAHLTFMAKYGDVLPVPFFAEVCFSSPRVSVTTCAIITADSAVPLSGGSTRCVACQMHHPQVKYVAGREGGTVADYMSNGRFWAVKSKLFRNTSESARDDFYRHIWSGDTESETFSRHTR